MYPDAGFCALIAQINLSQLIAHDKGWKNLNKR